jgi:ketosteroid isomerase-like protein
MSQENVEILRAFLEPWGREAWTLEAWQRGGVIDMSFLDPDVIYEDANLPDHVGEAYRGHEGIVRAAERWIEPFEWLVIELEQIVDAGDRLVSIHRGRSKARHTGIEFEEPVAYLWTLRDGKVVHFRSFRDPDEALEAAGLPE